MTRNDTPDKLECSIRPRSGTDSAQWDWGISDRGFTSFVDCEIAKYLGMYIDENLKWDEHINGMNPRISAKIGILISIRRI